MRKWNSGQTWSSANGVTVDGQDVTSCAQSKCGVKPFPPSPFATTEKKQEYQKKLETWNRCINTHCNPNNVPPERTPGVNTMDVDSLVSGSKNPDAKPPVQHVQGNFLGIHNPFEAEKKKQLLWIAAGAAILIVGGIVVYKKYNAKK